jgi:hypothetical protein
MGRSTALFSPESGAGQQRQEVRERAHAERAAAREHLAVPLQRHLEQREQRFHLPLVHCSSGGGRKTG